MLHFFEEILLHTSESLMIVLELMGGLILLYGSILIFFKFLLLGYEKSSTIMRIKMARTIALALEFYLAAEILKTVTVRELNDLYIIGAIIVIRIAMGFVIHHEMEQDIEVLKEELCNFEADESEEIEATEI
ncbi:MAG: DUF1622 domain-containing protein [Bacillota bacterium]